MKKLLKLLALIAASSCAAVTPAFAQSARQMTRSSLPGDSSLLITSDTTATPGVFATRAISYAAFRSALGISSLTFDSLKATTFYAGNGALATPSITANSFRSTGLYWVAGPSLRIAVNGAQNLSLTETTIEPQVQIGGAFGSVSTPAFGWGNDGIYRAGADSIGVAGAGKRVALFSGVDTSTTLLGPLKLSANTGPNNCVICFVGDNASTGISHVNDGWWFRENNNLIAAIDQNSGYMMALNSGGDMLQSTDGAWAIKAASNSTDDSTSFWTDGLQTLRVSGGASATILGGAGNMTIIAGSGNSRTVTIQTTNGGGVAQTNATFAADQTTTFNSTVQVGGSGQFRSPNGSAATPGHAFANATGSGMYVETTANPDTLGFTSQGAAFLKGISDTLIVWNEAKAPSLTAASGTPNTVCIDATSKQILENAASNCTVSSRRFKTDIRPLSYSQASYITRNLQPSTFTYRQGGRKAIGLIAEQADSVDSRLATRDSQGRINSVNYEQVTVVLLRQVQELQARLDRMCKAGVTSAC